MAAGDLFLFQHFFKRCNLIVRPCNNAELWTVERSDCHITPQQWLNLRTRLTDAHHATAWQFLHQFASLGDHLQSVFETEHTRGARSCELSDRMADQCRRLDAPRNPDLRQ